MSERTRSFASDHEVPVIPAALEPLKQTLLAILADIDLAHDLELEATRKSAADEALKAKLINALLRRHREKREPYMQELMNLEHRMQRVLTRA